MMSEKEKVEKIVHTAVRDINKSLLDKRHKEELKDIPLQGSLDSLSMVNLVVSLEGSIKKEFGRSIPLIGADVSETNPFKTVGTITDYICLQLENNQGGYNRL